MSKTSGGGGRSGGSGGVTGASTAAEKGFVKSQMQAYGSGVKKGATITDNAGNKAKITGLSLSGNRVGDYKVMVHATDSKTGRVAQMPIKFLDEARKSGKVRIGK